MKMSEEAPRAYFGDPYQTSPRGGFLRSDLHSPSGETERGHFPKRPALIVEAPRAYFRSARRFIGSGMDFVRNINGKLK